MPESAPYGSWKSPITAADVAAAGTSPQWLDVVDGQIWWAEARPSENGRVALVRADHEGHTEDLLPAPWNARNRLHEYGARPWLALPGAVAFTHWADQRIHRRDFATGEVTPLTTAPEQPHGTRYGDLRHGLPGEIWAVRETTTGPRRTDITRALVSVPETGGPDRTLATSHHFLTSPQLSPDHTHAAWLGWNHPDMPWDSTELCLAEVHPDGTFGPHRVLAGGPGIAVCQLEWENTGTLLALLDPDGWWNLHRITFDPITLATTTTNLAPVTEELGGALWKTGSRWFTPLGNGRHAVLNSSRLAILDEHTATVTELPDITHTAGAATWAPTFAPYAGGIAGITAGPHRETTVVHADLTTGTVSEIATHPDGPDPAYLPAPEERTFTAPDGGPIPAYLYPPTNPAFTAPDSERPPYLIHVHGGPTGRNHPVLDLDFAYFTSRGIGVVAVNYGGSTGYGRRYRERLREQWGVVDIADCVAVAEQLVTEGLADPARLAIRGGSAGGFTSAAAITTRTTFAAATVKYPILDLSRWTADGGETHDFEAHYLDGLIGARPEHEDRYRDRSPIHHAATLAGPVLFLQGLDDQICPPDQADRFVAGLRGTGIPHAYLTFEGEQHGFRRAETVIAATEAELAFYGQVFGFETPGVDPVELHS